MSNENENATTESEDAQTTDAPEPEVWPLVVTLNYPVTFGKEVITTLEFRRGCGGDLKDLAIDVVPPANKVLELAARLCNRSIKVMEKLDPDDIAEVMAIGLRFFERCLKAGKKRSR